MTFNSSKLYFSIGEASKELEVEQHVLRFWEKQFKQIQPTKNNNRRLYTIENLKLIRKIKNLLHNKGYTIKGVQKFLSQSSQQNELLQQDNVDAIMDCIKQLRYIQSRLEKNI